ncbi:hypothetical protein JVT61DRAFT_6347 [Boletus reticuloceps]|uniref:Uncharacterized protein n=1 Tax=Boletus reticuloceps TaxID=495285 RepID=A0A8I2YKN8_9AGAM|nr:hypothetical protein JVT61DRAFT_6347 [Boletus reticuloceps]
MMLRLSRLPRAHPGVVVRPAPGHANPYFLDRARFIDPAHPAAQLSLRNLPAFVCPHFTMRAFPDAILLKPTNFVPPNPLLATALVCARTPSHLHHKWWSNLDTEPRSMSTTSDNNGDNLDATQRRLVHLAARGRHSISLLFHTSKKATSKSSVVRRRLRSKMTAAICLVIGRNADAVDNPEIDHPASSLRLVSPRKPTPHPPLHLVSLQEGETLVLQGQTASPFTPFI